MKLLIIANNNIGSGLSGGDRIFLELSRYWSNNIKITVIGGQETGNLIKKYKIKVNFILTDKIDNSPIILHQLKRLLKIFPYLPKFKNYDYIYSASDFIPDSLPAFFAKLFFPKIKWIAGFYLFAPNPLDLNSPYQKTNQTLKGILYFTFQLPIYLLVRLFSDIVFVTSNPDVSKFPGKKTIVIRGGVTVSPINNKIKKIYDAIYIGRLHPQKGVIELIDIWKHVVKIQHKSKLVIIGDGELLKTINNKIKKLKLSKNIKLFGFLDGPKKNKIILQSKIVVHPATYDSGGMAAAEAMSFGLPGVSFDLEALKTYYPQGIIKTPCFDLGLFSKNILELLNNKKLYSYTSKQAKKLILKQWDWHQQSKNIFNETFS